VLGTLLSTALESYVEYKAEKGWIKYFSQIFLCLGIALLLISNFVYFTEPVCLESRKAIFLLIAAAGCFGIFIILKLIIYYAKEHAKRKLTEPFLKQFHLLENLLEKTQILTKEKDEFGYKLLAMLGLAGVIFLLINRYLKK